MNYVEELYEDVAHAKLNKILKNSNHSLYKCFRFLPHGVRMSAPNSRTNRHHALLKLRDSVYA